MSKLLLLFCFDEKRTGTERAWTNLSFHLLEYLEIRYNLTSMKKNKRLFILLTLYFSISQIDAQTPLSFEESLHLLNQGNQSLKIADKSIEIAKAERDKLNAFWYPSLQSTGAFVHMSEKIEVKQP